MFRGFGTPATTSNSGETGNPAGMFVHGRNNRRNSSFQSGFPLGTPGAANFGTGGDRGFLFGGPHVGGYGSPQSQQPANYLNTENVVMEKWSSDKESRESVLETYPRQDAEMEAKLRELNEQLEQLKSLLKEREDEFQRSATGSTGPQMGAYGSLQTQQPAHYLNTENVETEEWISDEASGESTLADIQFFIEQSDRFNSRMTRYLVEAERIVDSGIEHFDELNSESMRRLLDNAKAELARQPTRARGEGRRRNAASDGQHYEDFLANLPWQTIRGRGGDRRRDGRRLSSSDGQDNEDFLADLPWQTIRGRGGERRREGRRLSSSNRQDNEQLAADLTRHSARARGRGRGREFRRRSPSPIGEDYEALLALDERLGEVRQQGLSSKEIAQLPISSCKKQTNGGAAEECNICMEAYVEGQRQRRLPCFHCFHVSCIDQWLKEKASCPICRVDIHIDRSTP